MKITRLPGDSDGYLVPSRLVNWLVGAIFSSLVSIGAYMVIWNRSDNEWKTALMIRLETIQEKIGALQERVDKGILPRTEERLDAINRRVETIEREHERQEGGK
jgi:hypothetical protein